MDVGGIVTKQKQAAKFACRK